MPEAANDGRPKALQIETAAIKAKNCPLNELRVDPHFAAAMKGAKEGWLFATEESGQFPHYQEDLRALPARLLELLCQEVRVGRRRGQSGSEESTSLAGLAPEANKSEMESIEGWYVTTSCVQVAFANSYTHKATLRTKTFVDDFPVHVWLFLPPSSPDSSLPSSPSPQPRPFGLLDPRFSIIAHVPAEVRAELERLQLLFIMRLKDSVTAFKTSLMKFLDPATFAPHLKETMEARRLANKEADLEPPSPTVTISGCIILNGVEASIMLPTLFPSTTQSSTSETPQPEQSHDLLDQLCDQQSTASTAMVLPQAITPQAVTPTRISPSLEESFSAGVTEQEPPPQSPTQVMPNGLGHSNSETNTSSCSLPSVTGSPSPSLVSLPVILEAGSAASSRGTCISTSNLVASHNPTLPHRSQSAVELHPHQLAEQGVREGQSLSSSSSLLSGREGLARCNGTSSEVAGEEEFVLVKYPTLSPQKVMTHPATSTTPDTQHAEAVSSSPLAAVPSSPPARSFLSATPNSPSPSDQSRGSRHMKSPPFVRTKPQFVLHACVGSILALPNIKAGEIAMKLSAATVTLRELSSTEYQGMKELRKKAPKEPSSSLNSDPSIKARLEVGSQVSRFYPAECAEEQDIILIAKAEGLDLSLLLPNITIMKDFFDDEFEAVLPLPLHMKVATTRAVLVEDLTHSADHVQSMAVGVEQLELHRGRELRQEADVFLEATSKLVSR